MDPHLLHSSVPRIRRLEDTARRHRVYAPGLCVSQLNPASIGTVGRKGMLKEVPEQATINIQRCNKNVGGYGGA